MNINACNKKLEFKISRRRHPPAGAGQGRPASINRSDNQCSGPYYATACASEPTNSNIPNLSTRTNRTYQLEPTEPANSNLPNPPTRTYRTHQLEPTESANSNLPNLPTRTYRIHQLEPADLTNDRSRTERPWATVITRSRTRPNAPRARK